jgi:hypothetical protein
LVHFVLSMKVEHSHSRLNRGLSSNKKIKHI